MVGCRSPPIAPAGARYRSAGSSLSNHVNTVCRKLPTMMPTDVIIAIAVASAATRTEVLRNDPPRLRDASRASTPRARPSPLETFPDPGPDAFPDPGPGPADVAQYTNNGASN